MSLRIVHCSQIVAAVLLGCGDPYRGGSRRADARDSIELQPPAVQARQLGPNKVSEVTARHLLQN
jgi:hypothetical protein